MVLTKELNDALFPNRMDIDEDDGPRPRPHRALDIPYVLLCDDFIKSATNTSKKTAITQSIRLQHKPLRLCAISLLIVNTPQYSSPRVGEMPPPAAVGRAGVRPRRDRRSWRWARVSDHRLGGELGHQPVGGGSAPRPLGWARVSDHRLGGELGHQPVGGGSAPRPLALGSGLRPPTGARARPPACWRGLRSPTRASEHSTRAGTEARWCSAWCGTEATSHSRD